MRFNSMDKETERSKSYAGYYLGSAILAVVVGVMLLVAFDLFSKLVRWGFDHWYVVLGVLLLIVFIKKRKKVQVVKHEYPG